MMQQNPQRIISLNNNRTPLVSDTAWVAPGAVVVGNVHLSPLVSVWYNAVLRGDSASITIGKESNLQDGVVVHVDSQCPVVIGARVSIGHNAVVHGATIGDDTLIGMNSTILSGAVIGAQCLVAAGALVPQGKIIPDGSLVAGIPAKVVRSLTADEKAKIRNNAATYVDHLADHAAAVHTPRTEMY